MEYVNGNYYYIIHYKKFLRVKLLRNNYMFVSGDKFYFFDFLYENDVIQLSSMHGDIDNNVFDKILIKMPHEWILYLDRSIRSNYIYHLNNNVSLDYLKSQYYEYLPLNKRRKYVINKIL